MRRWKLRGDGDAEGREVRVVVQLGCGMNEVFFSVKVKYS